MEKMYLKALTKKSDDGGYTVLASTSAIDRQGDSIDQSGWDVSNYKNNPVMLWAHDYSALPIAKATSVAVTSQGLTLGYEFAPAEGNPMAQQVKTLVDGGFLNAVSVGFMPLERNGNSITKMELFEVSFVPVPANPQALQLMMSKGITRDTLEKFFDAKKDEIDAAEKGAVSDELTAEQVLEQKYNNLGQCWDIMYAFMDVYLDDAQSVDSFASLLTETLGLLNGLTGNTSAALGASVSETKALIEKANLKDGGKTFIQKMGAAHSAATKKTVAEAIDHNSASTALLKNMLESGDDDGDADEPAGDEPDNDSADDEKGVKELRSLLDARNLIRKGDTAQRTALNLVNNLIEQKRASISV